MNIKMEGPRIQELQRKIFEDPNKRIPITESCIRLVISNYLIHDEFNRGIRFIRDYRIVNIQDLGATIRFRDDEGRKEFFIPRVGNIDPMVMLGYTHLCSSIQAQLRYYNRDREYFASLFHPSTLFEIKMSIHSKDNNVIDDEILLELNRMSWLETVEIVIPYYNKLVLSLKSGILKIESGYPSMYEDSQRIEIPVLLSDSVKRLSDIIEIWKNKENAIKEVEEQYSIIYNSICKNTVSFSL